MGGRGPVLRLHRPAPTVAFGRRDALLPGYARAARAARAHGFTPVVRAPGGRAAAYHEGCLVSDELAAAQDAMSTIAERFANEAGRQARALRRLSVDARVGEVPGEYCPGAFSVNARGTRKLVGAAQRVVRGAWLLSSVVVIERPDELRDVLEQVYGALELEWNPETVGAVADEAEAATPDAVQQALLDVYAERYRLEEITVPPELVAMAAARLGRHVVRD
jgi:lipoate-protein ligase A